MSKVVAVAVCVMCCKVLFQLFENVLVLPNRLFKLIFPLKHLASSRN